LGGQGRLIVAHQPHRFTRLSSLFADFATCFNGADVVAIAEVYSAGEDPIPGADRDHLVAADPGRRARGPCPDATKPPCCALGANPRRGRATW
jgi:UDP-N-acetylmuramate-alanine ligase